MPTRRASFWVSLWVAVLISLSSSGCWVTTDYTLAKRSAIDAQIAAARVATQAELKSLGDQQVVALNQALATHAAREQAAADHLFKGLAVAGTLKAPPTRPELVMSQSIEETAAQLPPASAAAQVAALKALQTELDETKMSTEALKAKYEGDLTVARAQGDAATRDLKAKEDALKDIDTKRIATLTDARAKEASLQETKDQLTATHEAKLKEDAANAAHNENLKRWLMAGLGVIALVAGAAAVYLPIPSVKPKLTIVAVAAGVLAFCVPFIQWYHVAIGIAVVCIPVGLAILRDYHQEHADSTDTMRGLNEAKVKLGDGFTAVENTLKEWHDPSFKERLQTRLKQVGDI